MPLNIFSRSKLFKYLYILSGVIIAAVSLNLFLIPNHLAAGGVSGLSTVLNYITSVPVGLISIICNLPLYVMGYIYEGKGFLIKSVAATTLLGFFIDFFSFLPHVVTDMVLASLFGGVLTGLGFGMVLQADASTGGTDIIAKVINRKIRHISIGTLIFIIDMAVIIFAVLVFKNIYNGLYSVVALYACSKIIDLLLEGANFAKLSFVISDDSINIAKEITNTLHRGATFLNGNGVYTNNKKNVILCSIKKNEIAKLKELVYKIDKKAFVIITDAREVLGEGFMNI